MKKKILIGLIVLIGLVTVGIFVYKKIHVGKNTEKELAAELGLPKGYKAEFLLKPNLSVPHSITATPDDQLLVAEEYGSRLLRINPLTAEIDVLYNLPRGQWSSLLSDGADGAYMNIRGKIAHINGNGTYTVYSNYNMNPAALGPNDEIYGFTKSDVLVLQSKGREPRTIATGFSGIFDLVRDKEGNLYVLDWDLGTITKIKPDGTKQLLTSGLLQRDPVDMGFAPDGTMYVNEDTGSIDRFYQIDTNNGRTLRTITWFAGLEYFHPIDFTFLSNGKAYFVDPVFNNILSVDLQKETIELVTKGGGNSRALDVGPDGAVYIGDSNGFPIQRSRILRVQLNGSVEVYADNLDAITDLSFAPDGNMFFITRHFGEKKGPDTCSVFLITPKREKRTLASWDNRYPGFRALWSISVDPKTGLAIASDQANNELISIDENGTISVLPNSFDFEIPTIYLNHATDGTLYAIELNRKGFCTTPGAERNIIRFDDKGNPKIITNFNNIGDIGTSEDLAIAPDGTIYALGQIEGSGIWLWKITNDGETMLLADKLPRDPMSVAADEKGDIYVASSAGLLRIWKEK